MKGRLGLILLLFFIASETKAQLGGSYTYSFLKLPASPVVAALGGDAVARKDDDINQVYFNPASLNPKHHNQLSFNTALYYSGINFGYLGYGRDYSEHGFSLGAGIQYVTYGKFTRRDVTGADMGQFSAGEYAFNLTYSQDLGNNFRGGVSLKLIGSNLEAYNSFGIATDWGVMYSDSAGNFSIGASVQNLGYQVTTYAGEERESLPLNIKLGMVRELENAPFRFYIVVHNLQQLDISYNDPSVSEEPAPFGDTTATTEQKNNLGDKIARHFIVGTEVLLGDNIRVRVGYNHLRRQELKLANRAGLTGFSFGLGLRISKLRIDYSMANYHLAGATHQFGLSTNLGSFIPSLE